MLSETKEIKDVLRDCQILIVEDDNTLAKHLITLFKNYTGKNPSVAHYMDQASNIFTRTQGKFNLAIVDIMLPETQQDYTDIQYFETKLEELRIRIERAIELSDEENKKIALTNARFERAQALREMQNRIKREGGIELVEKWRSTSNLIFPILYLTSVGDEVCKKKGLSVKGGNLDWVIKPVHTDLILNKCFNLLTSYNLQAGGNQQ
jgi:DNA-binding response OmpR family regulator